MKNFKPVTVLLIATGLTFASAASTFCTEVTPTEETVSTDVLSSGEDIASAADLFPLVEDAVSSVRSLDFTADINSGFSVEQNGLTISMPMSINLSVQTDKNNTSHYDISVLVGDGNADGMNMRYEMYQKEENGEEIVYTSINGSDWMVDTDTLDEDPSSDLADTFSDFWSGKLEGMKLKRETNPDNGKEVYRLTGTLNSASAADALDSLSEAITGESSDVNLSFQATSWVDAETYLPVRQIISLEDGSLSTPASDDTNVAIDNFDIDINYLNFSDTEGVEIPEEVVSTAKEISDDSLPDLESAEDLFNGITDGNGLTEEEIPNTEADDGGVATGEIPNEETKNTEVKIDTEETSTDAELISDNQTHVLKFDMFGTLNTADTDDGIMYVSNKDFAYEAPEFSAFFIESPDLDIEKEASDSYSFSKTYYADNYEKKTDEYSDVSVSDLQETQVDGRPAYYYQTAYTDVEFGFSHTEYKIFVGCDDEFVEATLSSSADVGEKLTADDTYLQEVLDHLTIADSEGAVAAEEETASVTIID